MTRPLTRQEQVRLLGIAREAIHRYLSHGTLLEPTCEEDALTQHRGVFVTLTQNGELRGCIGTFFSNRPLCQEVAIMAIAAAAEDPRFYPMDKSDLGNFAVEISVLSPLHKTEDPLEIKVGEHGIYLEQGGQRGVLLPQVAVEHHWDRETFLQNTCTKAGLAKDAWQNPDCDIYLFTAQILKES